VRSFCLVQFVSDGYFSGLQGAVPLRVTTFILLDYGFCLCSEPARGCYFLIKLNYHVCTLICNFIVWDLYTWYNFPLTAFSSDFQAVCHILLHASDQIHMFVWKVLCSCSGEEHRNLMFAQLEVIEGDEEESCWLRYTSFGEKNFGGGLEHHKLMRKWLNSTKTFQNWKGV